MYVPAHFAENDRTALHALMRAAPFATWITQGEGELLVNHIPFLLDVSAGEFGVLRGHVARANPVWRTMSLTLPSVVVFQGPQAYVTPSWYPSKREHGKVVPTWNYAVVHAHGTPRRIEDPATLLALVSELTDAHEANHAAPWRVADAPADYVDKLLQAIVGIEIPIARLVGKWKISQNQPPANRRGVVEGLAAADGNDAQALAALMRAALPPGENEA